MLSWSEILIRLLLASLFGALIGLERERKDWTAGLRTHMMVCVGSCLIMMVSAFGFADILGGDHITLDPSRIAAQVISGIGFIGAGTILFLKQGTIRGLTTASGLWTVAAIGLATGGGLYFAASATTVIALIILWALQPVEQIYSRRFKQRTLRIVTTPDIDGANFLAILTNKGKLEIESLNFEKNDEGYVYQVKLHNTDATQLNEVLDKLKQLAGIKEIFWNR
ncbi:MAG: MgtC/SapB family protein [Chitinophagaceae bacterium]|nr:MgtC/SapB family protein [Chitinophagaceae bacterium]